MIMKKFIELSDKQTLIQLYIPVTPVHTIYFESVVKKLQII